MVRTLKSCGTLAAYRRHKRRRELACDACVMASRLYNWERAHPGVPYAPARHGIPEHGTMPAYRRHKRYGETVCEPCRQECARYVRERRHVRKQAALARRLAPGVLAWIYAQHDADQLTDILGLPRQLNGPGSAPPSSPKPMPSSPSAWSTASHALSYASSSPVAAVASSSAS